MAISLRDHVPSHESLEAAKRHALDAKDWTTREAHAAVDAVERRAGRTKRTRHRRSRPWRAIAVVGTAAVVVVGVVIVVARLRTRKATGEGGDESYPPPEFGTANYAGRPYGEAGGFPSEPLDAIDASSERLRDATVTGSGLVSPVEPGLEARRN